MRIEELNLALADIESELLGVRLDEGAKKRANKIKFGKFESISGYWDDDKEAPVLINGVEVGYVRQVRQKESPFMPGPLMTYSYEFTAMADGFEDVSVDVRTSRREIRTAAAAKQKLKALILSQVPA